MSRNVDENIGQSSAGAAVEHPPVSLYAKKQMPHELGIRIHKSFPDKLYSILSDPKSQHIISFKEDGRSWQVRDKQLLEKEVLPHYFRSGKYFSFTRKVLIWGFRRSGKATYYHELFCRDRRDLVVQMTSVSKSRDIVEIPRTLPHCTKVKRTRKKARNKEARDHNSGNKLSTNNVHLAGPVVRSGSVESADFAQGSDTAIAQQLLLLKQIFFKSNMAAFDDICTQLFCRDRHDLAVQMTSVSKSRDIKEIPRTLPHCTKVKRTRKKTRNKEARDHNSCKNLSTNSLHLANPSCDPDLWNQLTSHKDRTLDTAIAQQLLLLKQVLLLP